MLESISVFDTDLFRFINGDLANPITDFLMPIVTSDRNLRIAFAVALVLLFWRGSARTRWIALFSLLTLAVGDLISSQLLKPLFERARPCQTLTDIHLLVTCGSGFSMPSSHSVNSFAVATLFSQTIPKVRFWLLPLAFLIAISRVFVGVHYPLDVFVGAVIGTVIGSLATLLFYSLQSKGKLHGTGIKHRQRPNRKLS